MNIYGWIVLGALVADFGLRLLGDLLNLRALRKAPPSTLHDVYEAEEYRRSQEYTRERTLFGLLPATVGILALLAFWGLDGFDHLDRGLRELGWGPIPTGMAFVSVLFCLQSLLGLPFSLWSTFVIEERYGFNRTTPRTFFLDRLKALLLGLSLGLPLLAGVLYFFASAGSLAWLWCWIAVTLFGLVIQFVAPTWIMPLFNKFEPLGEGRLRAAILAYADSVGFPLEGVFVIDGSRRSSKGNAFFTGFGRTKRIALYDTLIEKQTESELVAVLAHEIGHYKRRHILQGTLVGIAHSGVVFWMLSIFLDEAGLFEAFSMETASIHAGLVFFGLLYTPVELILALARQALSRRNELQADAFAASTTGQPASLVSGLKKLSADSLTNLTPHPFYVLLHHSHPPLLRRVEALESPG